MDYQLRIVAPGSNPLRDRMRREHDAAELADELNMRAKAVLRELDSVIVAVCHYCQSPELYAPVPPGTPCPCKPKPERNGVVNHRSGGGYPARSDCRGPVEMYPGGAILSIR